MSRAEVKAIIKSLEHSFLGERVLDLYSAHKEAKVYYIMNKNGGTLE